MTDLIETTIVEFVEVPAPPQDLLTVAEQGPPGPKGDKGDPGDAATSTVDPLAYYILAKT